MSNCLACRYSYMEPDDMNPVCGHLDAGPYGTYIKDAAAEGGHCGPGRPKFEQHPLRTPDGSLAFKASLPEESKVLNGGE